MYPTGSGQDSFIVIPYWLWDSSMASSIKLSEWDLSSLWNNKLNTWLQTHAVILISDYWHSVRVNQHRILTQYLQIAPKTQIHLLVLPAVQPNIPTVICVQYYTHPLPLVPEGELITTALCVCLLRWYFDSALILTKADLLCLPHCKWKVLF